MDNRENKEKIDFKKRKENLCNSLFEVEHFLCNLKNITNSFKIYHIIKK